MIDLNQTKRLISLDIIYSYVSEIDVYNKYIDDDVQIGKMILSPLRKETRPSFGFFKGKSGEICFKDYLLGGGNCVKFVQMKFNLTYFEALSKIAIDFDFAKHYICKNFEKTKNTFEKRSISREEILDKYTIIKIGKNKRTWEQHDLDFWGSFGISIKTLIKYNVQAISYFHINDYVIKADKYAYCFIELKDGVESYKIYQPFNDKYKWINSHDESVWQGWTNLPEKGDDLIITKSLKDVMAINEVTGLPAIALQSEAVNPKKHIFQELDSRFQLCYLLYDNDYDKEINWGQQFAEKLSSNLGLVNIKIKDDYKSKDFSDLVKNVGKEQAKEILTKKMMIPF